MNMGLTEQQVQASLDLLQTARSLGYRHCLNNVESVGNLDYVVARTLLRPIYEQAQGRRTADVQQDAR